MLAMARVAQEQAKGAKREEVISNRPTAEYLQARIEVVTKQLIRRYGDILEVAITPAPQEGLPEEPPSIVDTANKQLAVDTATMSMIRAAEELMVLTRTMKELWLFGDLDTLVADQSAQEQERSRKTREDEATVVRGWQEWLRQNGSKLAQAPVQEQKSDADMEND